MGRASGSRGERQAGGYQAEASHRGTEPDQPNHVCGEAEEGSMSEIELRFILEDGKRVWDVISRRVPRVGDWVDSGQRKSMAEPLYEVIRVVWMNFLFGDEGAHARYALVVVKEVYHSAANLERK
jgi:hypothetical protein